MAKLREQMLTEISILRETSSVTNQTERRHIDALEGELESTRRQAKSMASQAKAEALKHAEDRSKQIEATRMFGWMLPENHAVAIPRNRRGSFRGVREG